MKNEMPAISYKHSLRMGRHKLEETRRKHETQAIKNHDYTTLLKH